MPIKTTQEDKPNVAEVENAPLTAFQRMVIEGFGFVVGGDGRRQVARLAGDFQNRDLSSELDSGKSSTRTIPRCRSRRPRKTSQTSRRLRTLR
jgi:hypothetical protein